MIEDADPDAARRQLKDVEARLLKLSPGTGGPAISGLAQLREIEQLEAERRDLRARLGLPQIDSPTDPDSIPRGWLMLAAAVVAILGIVWLIAPR